MTQTAVVVLVVWVLLSVAFVPFWAWALRPRRRVERALEAAEMVRAIELVERRAVNTHSPTVAASSTGGGAELAPLDTNNHNDWHERNRSSS